MAKLSEASALDDIVQTLLQRRQELVNELAEIDATFTKHGIPVPTQKGSGKAAKSTGKKRGRPAGSKNKTSTKKRGRKRGRGSFELSGEESVLAFVKSAGNPSTREVNDYWTAEGRGGKADNALTKLVKEGQLKRVKAKDVRGSRYKVA